MFKFPNIVLLLILYSDVFINISLIEIKISFTRGIFREFQKGESKTALLTCIPSTTCFYADGFHLHLSLFLEIFFKDGCNNSDTNSDKRLSCCCNVSYL